MSVHAGLNHVDTPAYTDAGDKPRDTLHDSLRQCVEEVCGAWSASTYTPTLQVHKCVELLQLSVQERRIPRHWRRSIRRLELIFMVFYLSVIVASLAMLMWPEVFY
jgi:hypothetical protein